jgi:hypothetical protein
MGETVWNNRIDLDKELLSLAGKASGRKLRLFAVACLHRIRHLFKHKDLLQSLAVAERFAEGGASAEELRTAEELAMWAGDDASWHSMQNAAVAWAAAAAAHREAIGAARSAVYEVQRVYAEDQPQQDSESLAQFQLFHDIFGPDPSRTLAIDPSWRTQVILALAEAAHEDRPLPGGTLNSARLAVLGDALLDAGCTDPGLLAHLRSPGPHVRGCHVLDMLAGRS